MVKTANVPMTRGNVWGRLPTFAGRRRAGVVLLWSRLAHSCPVPLIVARCWSPGAGSRFELARSRSDANATLTLWPGTSLSMVRGTGLVSVLLCLVQLSSSLVAARTGAKRPPAAAACAGEAGALTE